MQYGKKAIEKEDGDLRMNVCMRKRLSYIVLSCRQLVEEKKQMVIRIAGTMQVPIKHI
jgi:hypothetical protein